VLSHPPFAGLDHARVVRQLSRVGRLIGLSKTIILRRLLRKPVLASYSAKRYVAALRIGRRLCLLRKSRGNAKLLATALKKYVKSPYVPGTNRLDIDRAERRGISGGEPPLMKYLRGKLEKHAAGKQRKTVLKRA
ncbi:MAG: hypothetical protein AABW54_02215, partial [Candidatus Micrarchaeota archaeon]